MELEDSNDWAEAEGLELSLTDGGVISPVRPRVRHGESLGDDADELVDDDADGAVSEAGRAREVEEREVESEAEREESDVEEVSKECKEEREERGEEEASDAEDSEGGRNEEAVSDAGDDASDEAVSDAGDDAGDKAASDEEADAAEEAVREEEADAAEETSTPEPGREPGRRDEPSRGKSRVGGIADTIALLRAELAEVRVQQAKDLAEVRAQQAKELAEVRAQQAKLVTEQAAVGRLISRGAQLPPAQDARVGAAAERAGAESADDLQSPPPVQAQPAGHAENGVGEPRPQAAAAPVRVVVAAAARRPPTQQVMDEWVAYLDNNSASAAKPPPPMPDLVRAALLAAAADRQRAQPTGTAPAHEPHSFAAGLPFALSPGAAAAAPVSISLPPRSAALANWVDYLERDDCALAAKPTPPMPPLVALERLALYGRQAAQPPG
ncbi:hypothetical protein T492DRAFT_1150771 [Pavlovales sp. CCMP2436]|nr:hypothetical protein T492DRAFT_1150771 [Pavlovales sp. CCMP2436]